MDKAKVSRLMKLVRDTLVELGKKEGFSVDVGRGTYSDTKLSFKTTLSDGPANTVPQEEEDFRRYHAVMGFKLSDLHKKFKLTIGRKLETCTLIGLLPKGTKNTVAIMTDGGKTYRVPPEVVQRALRDVQVIPRRRPESEILFALKIVTLDIEDLPESASLRERGHLERKRADLIQELGRTPSNNEIGLI